MDNAAQSADDGRLTLRLSIEELNLVLAHLNRGIFGDVALLVGAIFQQLGPQLDEQQRRAALAAIPALSEVRN